MIYLTNCNNLELIRTLPDNSVDSVVTDPPYGISFMGEKWDKVADGFFPELWAECFRVLKPGGYLLAFGANRTVHRLACAIEDNGFVIRNQLVWLFASGWPKGMNISRAIDKDQGLNGVDLGVHPNLKRRPNPRGPAYGDNCYGNYGIGDRLTGPESDLAKQWEGWNTELKPASEPIVMAQKPMTEKRIIDNVLKYGTGGINTGACRITDMPGYKMTNNGLGMFFKGKRGGTFECEGGRWPANVIHDGSEQVQSIFPTNEFGKNSTSFFNELPYEPEDQIGYYCNKAKGNVRKIGAINTHPTVKPIKLMRWLVRLVTPLNGLVLEPFLGSGTTAVACIHEGFNCIGTELSEEYYLIAQQRVLHALTEQQKEQNRPIQQSLYE